MTSKAQLMVSYRLSGLTKIGNTLPFSLISKPAGVTAASGFKSGSFFSLCSAETETTICAGVTGVCKCKTMDNKIVFFNSVIASLLLCVNCFDVILILMDLFYTKDNFSLIVVN